MWYRSEIASIIYDTKEKIDIFKKENADIIKVLNDEFTDETLKYISSEDYDFIYLHGNDWKWYPSVKGVGAWDKLMELAEEKGLAVEFVRIGDDYEDVEVDYINDIQYYLTPLRTIEASF